MWWAFRRWARARDRIRKGHWGAVDYRREHLALDLLADAMELAGVTEYECRLGWAYFSGRCSLTASTGEETLAEARAILEAPDAP